MTSNKEILELVQKWIDRNNELTEQLAQLTCKFLLQEEEKIMKYEDIIKGFSVITCAVDVDRTEYLRIISDGIKERTWEHIVVLAAIINNRISVIVRVSPMAIEQKIYANELIKEILKHMNGNGGGNKEFAQGSSPEVDQIGYLIGISKTIIKNKLLM